MQMDVVPLIGIGVSILLALLGGLIRMNQIKIARMAQDIVDVRVRDVSELNQKIADITAFNAAVYARKDDVSRDFDQIIQQLTRIEDKLDKKVDR